MVQESTGCTEKEVSLVDKELVRVMEALRELAEVNSVLEKCLNSVLYPDMQISNGTPPLPKEGISNSCPLSEKIDDVGRIIDKQIEVVHNIIHRLAI